MRFICIEVNIVRRRADTPETKSSRVVFEEQPVAGENFQPNKGTINLAMTADQAQGYLIDGVYDLEIAQVQQ